MSTAPQHSAATPRLRVAAAAIRRHDGAILLSVRPAHTAHGGLWEFPGGKLEARERPVDGLARELVDCGLRADDRAWQMPLTEEYGEQLKSNFADFANVAGRDGGAITASAFLAKFTGGMHWAHLDIAGSSWVSGSQKSSTGRPMALLTEFLVRRASSR